ncbi:MAG: hypothetical protein FRX48_09553 [Lasallia pustulata]|uniref:Uncharacterized protein n=1 Tax=Lasallia pustulata TaxID=136370 RepID=A0A5M8PBJ2_9LECA|nr:MAG: hypothetical protein FRX48_09553 [Lasallia pustulata]
MFRSWAAFGILKPEQAPKKHPPPATPLEFPVCTPKAQCPGSFPDNVDLFTLFALPRSLDDINEEHVNILNINVDRDVPLSMLIPQAYLPLATWESDPCQSGGSDVFPAPLVSLATLSNGSDIPGHEVFYNRMKELVLNNDDIFRFINREPTLPGHVEAKVAQFRKFFEALYAMCEYWDTSHDNDTTPAPKQSMPPDDNAMDTNQDCSEAQAPNTEDDKGPYLGRRLGTGRDMPMHYREEAVKALVETIAWCFRCQVSNPRNHAKLKLGNMFVPVYQTALAYRPHQDRQRARLGFVEGPLLAIQCRAETVFRLAGEQEGEGHGEMLDLLREVGAMLLLAQERARQGKVEVAPGTDQWWATAPRWGGGPGGEIGIAEAASADEAPPAQKHDEAAVADPEADEPSVRLEDKKRRKLEKRRQRKNRRGSSAYHNLQAPASSWDKKTTYARIGKEEGSEYDDVYLVSSINHHLCILRLRVHAHFVEYLTTGMVPGADGGSVEERPWYGLDVRRSRWFDLLVPADRVQAMRGVWGVMAWLMRGKGGGGNKGGERVEGRQEGGREFGAGVEQDGVCLRR